jgi:3-deoxy-D-manno-octulosonic acid kinase
VSEPSWRSAGFVTVRAAGVRGAVDARLEPAVRAAGLLRPETLRSRLAEASGARGRAATAVLDLPGRREAVVVRPVRHGGLLGPWLRGALLGPGRPLRELTVNLALRAAGAPVPRPAFVLCWRRAGPVWNAVVATVLEVGAIDAFAFLDSKPSPARLLDAARAAGRALRRFHDAGGRHADLNLKNLLVREQPGACEVIVIDLDRARRAARVPPEARLSELMRLLRSVRKLGLLERVAPRGIAALFGAYVAGDRELRGALLASLPRERARIALHALGYRERRRRGGR